MGLYGCLRVALPFDGGLQAEAQPRFCRGFLFQLERRFPVKSVRSEISGINRTRP